MNSSRQKSIDCIGPMLVAMIIAAGPGLCAVRADLAEQADSVLRRRQSQSDPSQQKQDGSRPAREQPKDNSASFVAATCVKPADSESNTGPLALTLDSAADLSPLGNGQLLVVRDALVSHLRLHRPIYCALAPPVAGL